MSSVSFTATLPYVKVNAPGDFDHVLLVNDHGDGQFAFKELKPSFLKNIQRQVESLTTSLGILNGARYQYGLDIDALQKRVQAHAANQHNPHQVTKAQVGLGNVDDFATATNEETVEGLRTDRFVTPASATALLEQRAFILTRPVTKTKNVAFEEHALADTFDRGYQRNLALGNHAAHGFGKAFTDTLTLGARGLVTGSDTLQLGSPDATVYTSQPLQHRTDSRDLAEVKPEPLGLPFVLALNPVVAKLDLREDYIDYSNYPEAPVPPQGPPEPPTLAPSDPRYQSSLLDYMSRKQAYTNAQRDYQQKLNQYRQDVKDWIAKNQLKAIAKDGSQTRQRQHHLFVADELKAIADTLGVDFSGFQDHALHGGLDIKTSAPDELLGPIVKAIQELYAYVRSDGFADRIVAKLLGVIDGPSKPDAQDLKYRVVNRNLPGLAGKLTRSL